MPLIKDDIDAVSMLLHVEGELAFSILLTRGGLTKRLGSSEGTDRGAIMVTGGTDSYFEELMNAVPEALLEGGGRLEDDGRDGPRHDWTFEFASGPSTVAYRISFHWGSASLPDEFADLVVRAETLTHSWYAAGLADATGAPRPAAREAPAERPSGAERATSRASGPKTAAQPRPATKERIALAVLLDLFALSIPYSFVHWMIVGDAERTGPPGGALMLFAIVEFLLLQVARRSPGYWLLGISAPPGEKPRVDPERTGRESPGLLATGVALCGLGVVALTAWTTYHTPVPYFGLSLPLWLSIPVTLLGSLALISAGALVVRLDVRGVWLGTGLAAFTLLGSVVGWSAWPAFVSTVLGSGAPALLSSLAAYVAVAVAGAILWGLFESWRRLAGSQKARAGATKTPPASSARTGPR